jgi:hypothetical protein
VANGEAVCNIPVLARTASILRWVPVCEAVIEGPHAYLQRKIINARRHGGPMCSLALRGPELDNLLESSPIAFNKIAANVVKVMSPLSAIQALGLENHPSLPHGQLKSLSVTSKLANQIIYLGDAKSQQRSMGKVNMKVTEADKKRKRLQQDVEKQQQRLVLSKSQAVCGVWLGEKTSLRMLTCL